MKSLLKNNKTGALIIIMIALVAIGYFIATGYYTRENNSVDPRIVPARELYSDYDERAKEGNYNKIFSLLDSVESVYKTYKHYEDSYELGVLYNNRSAALITIAIYRDSIRSDYNPMSNMPADSILAIAELNVMKAVSIYDAFVQNYGNKDAEIVKSLIKEDFYDGMQNYDDELKDNYLDNRVDEIIAAIAETDRRLSVSYTNLGVIRRLQEKYEEAAVYYKKAIELWDRNLSAENNLNALLGKPLKRRNIIQKLFPPER
ncbi:MAG: tetratricopeptide repeat protein [Bacteroidales bacterium]|nr:tetratricopeptide repeat protein [Bacteroidales bacterium]